MEAIIGFFSNILSSILPFLFKKKERSEFDKQYEKLRFDVASALTMYACYYHNPVDLAKTESHKLPKEYDDASVELRKLGSTASALAATIPEKGKKLPITKTDLDIISGSLIGLSNSMHTPYNCGTTREERDFVTEREKEIRKILHIEKANS